MLEAEVSQGESLGTNEVIFLEDPWGTTVRVQGPEIYSLKQEKVKNHVECGRGRDSQG